VLTARCSTGRVCAPGKRPGGLFTLQRPAPSPFRRWTWRQSARPRYLAPDAPLCRRSLRVPKRTEAALLPPSGEDHYVTKIDRGRAPWSSAHNRRLARPWPPEAADARAAGLRGPEGATGRWSRSGLNSRRRQHTYAPAVRSAPLEGVQPAPGGSCVLILAQAPSGRRELSLTDLEPSHTR